MGCGRPCSGLLPWAWLVGSAWPRCWRLGYFGVFPVPAVCLCAGLCGGSLLGNGCDRLHFGSGVEILLKGVLAVFGVSLGCWCPSEAACRLRSGLCGADVAAGGVAGALGVAVLSSAASLNLGRCCGRTLGDELSPWAPNIVLARVAGQWLPAWLGLGEDSALWGQ